MNLDDLMQYVPEESFLIGLQMKCRAFLLVQMRYINIIINTPVHTDHKLYYAQIRSHIFRGKCMHRCLIDLHYIILERRVNLNLGLSGACEGGHLDLVNFLISKGAKNWNTGLYGASRGGHLNLVKLMIVKGADTWKLALKRAKIHNQPDLIKLLNDLMEEPRLRLIELKKELNIC